MINDDLLKIGLKENEAQVYLELLSIGRAKAGDIIKQTGLHRNLVYQALEALIGRRLVTKTTQSGIFHFQTTDLEHLRDIVREQDLAATRLIESLKERAKLTDQEITVYEGDDAIRAFSLKNASRLKPGEKIYVLGSAGRQFDEAMGEQGVRAYVSEISQRQGSLKILTYQRQTYGKTTTEAFQKIPQTEIRVLPFDAQPSAYVVFTDSIVAFLIFEKPYTVIEVANSNLARAYRNYFEILWNQNVRVEQGLDALRDAWMSMLNELGPGEAYDVLGGASPQEYGPISSLLDEFHRERISRGVVFHILAKPDAAVHIRERNRRLGDPDEKISHVKNFTTPFLAPMQINMVHGRAFIVIYKKEGPTVIHFEDKEVHDGFKLYFDEIWNRQTETLYGYDGIVALTEQVLETGKDLYLIGANGMMLKHYPKEYEAFTAQRVQKGIRIHILANADVRGTDFAKLPLIDIKFLPPAFDSPMVTWIFGDTVGLALWHKQETVFLINDAKTAEYYRSFYQALEKMAES